METLPFLVALPEEDAKKDEMRIFGYLRSDAEVVLQQIPVETLKSNIANVSRSMVSVLDGIKQVGQFKLKEVTLQVEVSANGGVNLIGTANLGGKGAITLKFME